MHCSFIQIFLKMKHVYIVYVYHCAQTTDDYVACIIDGWGSPSYKYSSADIIVRQWILSPFDIHTDYSFSYQWGDVTTGRVPLIPINLDNDIVTVQVFTWRERMRERKREKERRGEEGERGRERSGAFNILELNIMSYLPYTQGRG